MEMYTFRGESRMDCELKIAEKYKRPFHILREKEIRVGGILGMFSKPAVEVEFYFSPLSKSFSAVSQTQGYNPKPVSWEVSDYRQRQYADPASKTNLEEEKKKVIAAARKNMDEISASGKEASQQILDALKEIKERFDSTGTAGSLKNDDHPAFVRTAELLKSNDFSEKFIKNMIDKLRRELSLEQLEKPGIVQDRLLEWIGESINIFKEDDVMRKPRIMVLIGPTGVGKTTTITKLAAIYGIGTDEIQAVDVRMITIDAFRICAKEQLEQIGNIMQIPVSCVVNKQDLRKEIGIYSEDTDLFLIDTIGKSQKDSSKIGEMKEILDGAPRHTEYHLVIGAGTKASDIEDILRQFEPFNYKSVILSKMDETNSYGNVISALADKNKCISYLTVGQSVPVDIKRATVMHFLTNLEGFNVDREKYEKLFPSGKANQFKWR